MASDATPQQRPRRGGLRRAGGLLVAVAIGCAAVVALLLFLNSRDAAKIGEDSGTTAALVGAAHGEPQAYLDAAQLRLLAAGDVYLLYGSARAPPQLVALREQLSGPPDPAIEQAGQAVILARRPGTSGVVALAQGWILRTADPADPQLERFASDRLGVGSGSDGSSE